MTRKLIINADGFGFTKGINRGIVETVKCGLVQSTSALANFPAIDELEAFHNAFPQISIGVHLNLSVGKPVLPPEKIPSLVGNHGEFRLDFISAMLLGRIRLNEMLAELEAQVNRVVSMGIQPTHIDGHQNKHLYPPFFTAALQVAHANEIPCIRTHHRYLFTEVAGRRRQLAVYYARHPRRLFTHSVGRLLTWRAERSGLHIADRLITPGYLGTDHKASLHTWMRIIELLPTGWNEIYCHPGYPDDELRGLAYYVDERETEIRVLCDPTLREAAKKYHVEVVSFHDLIRARR